MQKQSYAYWVFYSRDDLDVYAYTDDKEIADSFRKLRKPSLFYRKKRYFTNQDLYELHREYPGELLKWVDYKHAGTTIRFALTICEDATVNHISMMKAEIAIPSLIMSVPPAIFTPEIQKALKDVGYVKKYKEYAEGGPGKPFVPDFFCWFTHIYGFTIDWEGEGVDEIISILHCG